MSSEWKVPALYGRVPGLYPHWSNILLLDFHLFSLIKAFDVNITSIKTRT